MKEKKTKASKGVTVTGVLGIVFVVLKLCKLISWSWWWVLAPFWIPFGLGLLVLIVYLVILLITFIRVKKYLK